MGNLEVKNNRLYIESKIYVPDKKKLQLHLLQKYHDSFKQRYFGYKAIFQGMQTRYYWLNMAKDCKNILSTITCTIGQKHIIFKNKVF